ncbi:MAG: hypothetical protein JNL69_07040 [Bacteroidia bacterium]|nr:hypothetical protein [Bacteroidia bacterium]
MNKKFKIKRLLNKTRFYFSFLFLAFYITIGFLFLFTDTWSDLLPKARITIGLTLVLFGLLRSYISYRRFSGKNKIINSLIHQKNETTNS